MAELALGTECPKCKTLTACSGNYTDETLTGQCGGCGSSVTMRNTANPGLAKDPAQIPPLEEPAAPAPPPEEPAVEAPPSEPAPEVTPEPEQSPPPEEPAVEAGDGTTA